MIGGECQRKTRVSGADWVVKWPEEDGSVGQDADQKPKVSKANFLFFLPLKLRHSTAVDHQRIPALSSQWTRSLFSAAVAFTS